jgi:hypothetical protein
MSSPGTERDSSASSDVDFDDYCLKYKKKISTTMESLVTNLNQNIRKKNSDKWKRQRVSNVGK